MVTKQARPEARSADSNSEKIEPLAAADEINGVEARN